MDTQFCASCQVTVTTAHVIQKCWRTHGGRILQNLGQDLCEGRRQHLRGAHLRTPEGLQKPNIIATKDGRFAVIDVQVVRSADSLSRAHALEAR